jgi:hypothetical protein
LKLHILVEGSAEAALLRGWLRRFLPGHTTSVIQHRGKGRLPASPLAHPDPRREGLLDQLPAKLRAYGRSLDPATDRLLVLVDLDDDDCKELKARLVRTWESCDPQPVALFRIAIEETEAFYLGDPEAIRRAFPRARLAKLKSYEQDSICGTWELFQQVIQDRLVDKPGWAEKMGEHLGTAWKGPGANRSPSFQQFCRALLWLAGESPSR